MNKIKWTMAAALLSVLMSEAGAAVDFDVDGATPGKWTMDLDAAKAVAAEKQLPILIDFSGSDWCGWCKVMEENVFTRPEWTAYAKENLMMVFIDYPEDKSLVPEKYIERNQSLKREYSIRGYPTFIVLDDDGETELGRLKSGRDKTPASFQAELKSLFRTRLAEIEKYCAALSEEDRTAYRQLVNELSVKKVEQKQAVQDEVEARNKVGQLNREVVKLEEKMLDFRVSKLSKEERGKFRELELKHEQAEAKLSEWMRSKPERNDENMKLYEAMMAEIKEIDKQLSSY